MITFEKGELLKAAEDIIGHQVNCMGVMRSGISKQIREEYPEAYAAYISLTNSEISPLGQMQIVKTKDKYIANLFGQKHYKKSFFRKQLTSIKALEQALIELRTYAEARDLSIALPYRIGADRNGTDWSEVYRRLQKVFVSYPVTLYSIVDMEEKG
ncbi:macro domain-containing protein [Paenibacillus provencensis]|uniref:Macro domain-containing protein n=1 Tax=Paenibacillus provencensis TaxID=441151 RepID=A0ABW3Q4Y9_9BACL|nr:macro domain-containing protein [Paenibacillus sp. MER 78]MCM3129410.1 macro domain-containing protein [Paenibacillus sp. MER 78]